MPLMYAIHPVPLSVRIAQSSMYHEKTSSVITEVPLSVMIGVVVSMINVAQVEFPAKSVTMNIFVHSFVMGSPLL